MFEMDYFSLEGKTAIVTGAGSAGGLCFAMAAALRAAGAKVVIWDVTQTLHEFVEGLGGEAAGYYAVRGDLTDAAEREKGFADALEKLGGRLDILVNGAGIQYREAAADFPADRWEKIIDVNLSSLFFLSQLAGRHMIANGSGKIINVASMTSFVASRLIVAYAASKGGVAQMTKALSNEWAGKGVNVNAIAPGYMITELTKNLVDTEQGQMHTRRIPAGRWGTGEDLKGTIVFLASRASDYVDGAIIPVDGGYLGA